MIDASNKSRPEDSVLKTPESTTDVVGYVEAVTEQAAIGWAWCQGQGERLKVALHLGDTVLSQAVADQSREDLARSGIGDGKHAFTLPIPPGLQARAGDLKVLAYSRDGVPKILEAPPAAAAAADAIGDLHRGVNTLISSQRLLHRNLQAALLQQGPTASTLTEITATQARLEETLATIELFVIRLEKGFQSQERPLTGAPPRRVLAATAGLSGAAFVISCWAMFRAVAGG